MHGGCCILAVFAALLCPCIAQGTGAVRELPPTSLPGEVINVQIVLDVTPGTTVVAAEDLPPPGWTISNISNSGTYDQNTGKVKWGLFFAPSIPPVLSYQATTAGGPSCFGGSVSFDGLGVPIAGDSCTTTVPATSTWGMICMGIAMAISATLRLQSPSTEEEGFEPP